MAAFERVVAEYEAPLLRYAGRIVARRDTAQDVVQDTFIRLFHHWPDEMSPSPQMATWLYRVAHNRAVDLLRGEARLRLLHLRHAEEQDEAVPADRGSGFGVSDEAARAATALQALNLREREIVVLKVYEEKSYKEIAEIMGLTPTNVGYILHHAMRKLAAELGNTGTI